MMCYVYLCMCILMHTTRALCLTWEKKDFYNVEKVLLIAICKGFESLIMFFRRFCFILFNVVLHALNYMLTCNILVYFHESVFFVV